MVTGRHPGAHGLAANAVVLAEISPARAIDALEPTLAQLAEISGGRVLLAPTLGEILAAHGRRYAAVIGGTSGNAYVHHPRAATVGGAVVHSDFSLPPLHHEAVRRRFGPWPEKRAPSVGRIQRVADVLLGYVLPEMEPDVATVWFPEPDTSQHAAGVGSAPAREALREADAQFGGILASLDRQGLDPDVLVVSDHGYSTITSVVDVEAEVLRAGFPPGERPGGVTVAPNGGAALLYVRDRTRPSSIAWRRGSRSSLGPARWWAASRIRRLSACCPAMPREWPGPGHRTSPCRSDGTPTPAPMASPAARTPPAASPARAPTAPGARTSSGASSWRPDPASGAGSSPTCHPAASISRPPSWRSSAWPRGSIRRPGPGGGVSHGAPSRPQSRTSGERVVERRTRTGRVLQRLSLEHVGAATYVSGLEACRA